MHIENFVTGYLHKYMQNYGTRHMHVAYFSDQCCQPFFSILLR